MYVGKIDSTKSFVPYFFLLRSRGAVFYINTSANLAEKNLYYLLIFTPTFPVAKDVVVE